MNSASRGDHGLRAEESRRFAEADAASEFRGAAAAVADEESCSDESQVEFDRRVARLREEEGGERLFQLALFDDAPSASSAGEETLAQTLAVAGSMPADVAEECVRGLLAALRSAHAARWSHGELSLDSFALDAEGRVSLREAGRRQRSAWFDGHDRVDPQAFDFDARRALDRRWNDAFLDAAADDLRRLSNELVPSLERAVDGPMPTWFERLLARVEALDGTVATIDDLEHAWRAIDTAFEKDESHSAPATEAIGEEPETFAIPDPPIDETAQDLPQPALEQDASPAVSVSGAALLWLCVAGGLAALAGVAATVIVRL